MNCSLARALDQVGDPWSLLILRECARRPARFEGLHASVGAARNILAARLRSLVDDGLLRREADCRDGRGATYTLTAKGAEVIPALVALMQWGDRWLSGTGREPVLLESAGGRRLARVALHDSGGARVDPRSVCFRPGPGADAATRMHLGGRVSARAQDRKARRR
jgi:DNA-binding HxlR family transcriptional regulator